MAFKKRVPLDYRIKDIATKNKRWLEDIEYLNSAIEEGEEGLEAQVTLFGRIIESIRMQAEEQKRALLDQGKTLKYVDETGKELEITVEHYEELKKTGAKITEQNERDVDLIKQQKKAIKEGLKDLYETLKVIESQHEGLQNNLETSKGMMEIFSNDAWTRTPFLSLFSNIDEANSIFENLKINFTGFASGMIESLKPLTITMSTVQKLIEATTLYAMSQDSAMAAFQASTNAAQNFDEEIEDSYRKTINLGTSIDDTSDSFANFYTNVSNFKNMTKESQVQLTSFGAALTKIGIDSTTTSQLFQTLNNTIGISAEEFENTTLEIIAASNALGISTKEMISSFQESFSELAVYGENVTSVFTKTTATARGLGLEIQNLLELHEKFDTFENAAESVGQLNAILGGGYLNAIDMVMTKDPTDRFMMLRNAVSDAGMSFNELSYYEKKAVSEAMGFPIDITAKMFGDPTRAKEFAASVEKARIDREAFDESIKKALPITQEFVNLFNNMAISIRPIINLLSSILETINKVFKAFDEFGSVIGGTLRVATVLFTAFIGAAIGKVLKETVKQKLMEVTDNLRAQLYSLKKEGVGAVKGIADSMPEAGKKTKDLGSAISGTSQNLKAMSTESKIAARSATSFMQKAAGIGILVAGIGIGVGAAAFGIAQLANAMKNVEGNEIAFVAAIIAIGGVMAGLALMASKLSFSLPVVLAFTVAMLGIGGAIALVGLGFKMIAESFATFADNLTSGTSGLFTAAAGIASMSVSILALGLSLLTVKTKDIEALGTIFMFTSKITNETADAIKNVVNEIKNLSNVIDDFSDIDKTINLVSTLTSSFKAPSDILVAGKNLVKIQPEVVEKVESSIRKNIFNETSSMSSNFMNKNDDALLPLLEKAILNAAITLTNKKMKSTPIVLMLNGKVIAETIMPEIEDRLDDKLLSK